MFCWKPCSSTLSASKIRSWSLANGVMSRLRNQVDLPAPGRPTARTMRWIGGGSGRVALFKSHPPPSPGGRTSKTASVQPLFSKCPVLRGACLGRDEHSCLSWFTVETSSQLVSPRLADSSFHLELHRHGRKTGNEDGGQKQPQTPALPTDFVGVVDRGPMLQSHEPQQYQDQHVVIALGQGQCK